MSTIQELNDLLKETQEELEIWQQVSILLLLMNNEMKSDDGMTEDEIDERLQSIAGGLRAAREKIRELGLEPDSDWDAE